MMEKRIIPLTLLFLLLSPTWLQAQEKGDVLQVDTTSFNARSSANFMGESNISFNLAKDDIAEIVSVRRLPSGNKALEIKVITGTNAGKSAWIYFDKKDPGLEVFAQMTSNTVTNLPPIKAGSISQASQQEQQTENINPPVQVEEERLRFSRQDKARKTAEDIEAYDRYLMSLLKDYNKDLEQQNTAELQDVVEEVIAFKPPVPKSVESEVVCSDCQDFEENDPFKSVNFSQCARNKDENRFIRAYNRSIEDFEKHLYTQDFKTVLQCVQGGMKASTAGSGGFFHCPEIDSFAKEATKSTTPPCLSQHLVGSVATEIYMASRCFEQDYKKVLPLLVHESRFYPTIRSVTGAGGIGQLTGVAIKEINRNLDRYIENYSKKPGCEYLRKIPKMHEAYFCGRVFAPTNPRHNTVFSLIYQRMLRDNKKLNPSLVVDQWVNMRRTTLSKEQKIQVEEMLLRTSYNSGPGSILTAFKSYAASPANRDLPFQAFMDGFSRYLKIHVRAEAAHYNGKVIKDTNKMNELAGVKCSI